MRRGGKPWKKKGGWPYIGRPDKHGRHRKSYQLGYRDHTGRVRSRSFPTQRDAEDWIKAYVKAERQNRLREFLLGSDAPEVLPDDTPLAELIADYLATDAHPESEGGLAWQTYNSYLSTASRHILGHPKI